MYAASTLGGPAHFKLNFKKYRLFIRLKFYHKKNIEETDGGLARRQNNGDNKPFSENRCIRIIFSKNECSLHRGYLGKNTLRSWREDPSDQEHRSIFLFSPASIRYANKSPIKNRWSYTSHDAMAFRFLYCHCFSPRWRPNPRRVLPSPSWHLWNPYTVSVRNG